MDNDDGRLVADFAPTRVYLHLTIRRWGAQKLKRYREILEGTLAGLARAGVGVVYATPSQSDTRAQKLIRLFGFRERGRANGLVVMERRTYA